MAVVRVFFETSEFTLTPDDIETLEDFVSGAQAVPPGRLTIVGNADNNGSKAGNLELSRKRAVSVRDFLVSRGLNQRQMKLVANGDEGPIADNGTEDGRAKNRRTDIVTRGGSGGSVGSNNGDRGEPEVSPPPLPELAPGEVPLPPDNLAVGAGNPWVGRQGILAPPRSGNLTQFFVDGRDYFADAAVKIRAASRFIFITDWALNAFVHLDRTTRPPQEADTLQELLRTAVLRGVDVRVLVWDSNKTFSNNRDREVERDLTLAGVRVVRHDPDPGGDIFSKRFSHHQKTLVMDNGRSATELVAYIGGLDFAAGRWDTPQHAVVGPLDIWVDRVGQGFDDDVTDELEVEDYYTGDFYNSDDPGAVANNAALRDTHARLPWHDIHARIVGPSAFDIQMNFVQRWNAAVPAAQIVVPTTLPSLAGSTVVQVIRSGSRRRIGPAAPEPAEASILDAYINCINLAQHHIYIENQFFTSNFQADSPIHNGVMIALANRIVLAITNKQRFRVKIVIPVHPEGDITGLPTQELLHWQYRTICRPRGTTNNANNFAPTSFIGRILAALGATDAAALQRLSEHLGFYNVRNHGVLGGGATVTSQIYVHSKMMLVDDRVAIIGSANINDRSLLGTRDTELSAIFVDNVTNVIPIDGLNRSVRKFAHDLRLNLWQEHLGLSSPAQILDPVSDASHRLWHDTAVRNTAVYEAVFPNIASDRHDTVRAMQGAAAFNANAAARLNELQGHLTLFPLNWLRNEDLETGGLADEIFTIVEPRPPSDDDEVVV